VIIIYLAVAGACAEDKANAGGGGGGGGGGGPPVGLNPPSQIYTAISNGGPVGFTVHTIGMNFNEMFQNNIGPQIISPFNGNSITNASMALTDLTSPSLNGGDYTIKLSHSMPASAFNSLIGTGFTGGGGSAVHIDETFFLFGWFLESPNTGVVSIPQGDIDILGASANFSSMGLAAKTHRSQVGQIYPLVDSTSFTNAAEALNFFAGPVTSNSHLGSNGVVTTGNTTVLVSGDTHCICSLRNFAGRGGTGTPNATAGQSLNIEFRIRGDTGQAAETTHFLYELILT